MADSRILVVEDERITALDLRAQKMEAIGRLAGGVAHDFNNILTAVRGFAELIVSDLDPTTQSAEDARQIIQSALSGAQLNAQLLAFCTQADHLAPGRRPQ